MSKLGNFDSVDSFDAQPQNKVETVPSATEGDRRKLEHMVKISESNPSNSKYGLDSNKGKDAIEKERLNKRDSSFSPGKNDDFVHSGTAIENPQYGSGGGKQYFIPNAKQMMDKSDGRLNKTGETNLRYDGPSYRSENNNKREIEKQKEKPVISVDNSPLSKSERAEFQQLDKNTMDERGLPKVMPNGAQETEDRMHPSSDQENTYGHFSPDAWSNPRKLKDGEKLYQLRPENAERTSPYFTDSETVNKCRKENGDVDAGKLLQALQINPNDDKNWTLHEYEYHRK